MKRIKEGKWWKALLWLVVGLIIGFLLGRAPLTLAKEENGGYWTKWQDVSECEAIECGTTKGIKKQERYYMEEVCEYRCPVVEFKCCHKTYNVEYEKSEDPHKCHRPSDATLKNKYGMSNFCVRAFKRVHKEWKDSIEVDCHEEVTDTEKRRPWCKAELIPCEEPTPTPTPEPTVTPTPTPKPFKGFELGGAPVCVDDPIKYAPTVTKAWKTNSCADIEWTTTDADRFNVYVGPHGENPHDYWSTLDIYGQSFMFCELPAGVVDVMVCSVSLCGSELCSPIVVDDLVD